MFSFPLIFPLTWEAHETHFVTHCRMDGDLDWPGTGSVCSLDPWHVIQQLDGELPGWEPLVIFSLMLSVVQIVASASLCILLLLPCPCFELRYNPLAILALSLPLSSLTTQEISAVRWHWRATDVELPVVLRSDQEKLRIGIVGWWLAFWCFPVVLTRD